ncbi:NAD(P)H-dependent oxidoreductase [Photobacterium angustum]|uniref:NAD(P)H-dependent oxidoreductase n=1 Tax=Photobacterium angustum TaxID=661 RepID=A0A855SHU6_PHOAN|nr:nitroreductase family protein [Photobacterium angustum]KJF82474.1 Major NAD(P)H-flavin oxidoreductase [Photobacterium damselae subsp. damselae]KJG34429.1 Major NAD(P)H-flavin oxidoreductase [Photobacterium angustum]KJG41853.1 Major NAD(P)H-flavin oxidoreductase [Photobacterium angustum]KJG46457.1 Major NAD(P)H-flavin oxidoreductase [Photobacterium angustum]KJG50600.1 Major NAD(P)H-flavin oxidoreductase [Photobacterium angustum]
MNSPILDDLNWRYTTKNYDPNKTISTENIGIISEALRLSASSINSQPWRFIILESDDAKQRFSNTFETKFLANKPHATNASHIILFTHNPHYSIEDFEAVIDKNILDGRIKPEKKDDAVSKFSFADLYTEPSGYNANWTKAQLYLAFGNILHVLARLKIDSTPLEGIDVKRVEKEFSQELDGFSCPVALAIGYHDESDFNARLPKSRMPLETVVHKI